MKITRDDIKKMVVETIEIINEHINQKDFHPFWDKENKKFIDGFILTFLNLNIRENVHMMSSRLLKTNILQNILKQIFGIYFFHDIKLSVMTTLFQF